MKPTPTGWPRLSTSIFYDDAPAAIDWLVKAFDFTVRLKVEGDEGRIEHSELEYGGALVMVGHTAAQADRPDQRSFASPQSIGGKSTQAVMLFVDDVDTHCAKARAAGAVIFNEPAVHDYGEDYWADRSYGAIDSEGHHWWFTQRLRGPKA